MNSRWGNVIEQRPKEPEVKVSFNRNDKSVVRMIARWFGLTEKEFKKLIEKHRNVV